MPDYSWWTPEVDDLIVRARQVAQNDPVFAERVFQDTNGAIKDRFGFEVPQKVQLVWLNDTTLGLKPLGPPDLSGDELSDELLDLVSAGTGSLSGPTKNQ